MRRCRRLRQKICRRTDRSPVLCRGWGGRCVVWGVTLKPFYCNYCILDVAPTAHKRLKAWISVCDFFSGQLRERTRTAKNTQAIGRPIRPSVGIAKLTYFVRCVRDIFLPPTFPHGVILIVRRTRRFDLRLQSRVTPGCRD